MKTTLKIDGMSCAHCVKHVANALQELEGVSSAAVSLEDNAAVVDHADSVTLEAMKAAVVEAGYAVV
ncbi:MAG: cation transporter [Treponema sp.]|jgi:copper ion binding protein|nr:cation transporter [Treponema sp.]